MMKTLAEGGLATTPAAHMSSFNPLARDYEAQIDMANFYNQQNSMSNMSNISNTESLSDRNSPLSYNDESEGTFLPENVKVFSKQSEFSGALAMDLSASEVSNFAAQEDTFTPEDVWRKYCQIVNEGQQCNFKENCDYNFQEHFHCLQDNCELILTSKDSAKEHSRNHEQQEIITGKY